MTKKRWVIALVAVSVCLVSTIVLSAERSHPASADGVIDPTCTSSNPCIQYTNNSSGPGIEGLSLLGNGVFGVTKNNSTSASNGRAGVLGNDLSTSGTFDSGVSGVSVRGTGVLGSSTSGSGLSGSSSTGNGITGNTKQNSTSSANGKSGVLGQDQSTSGSFDVGVTGTSVRGIGVKGVSTNQAGVQGVTSSNSIFLGGVSGSATGGVGVFGKATTGEGVGGVGHFAVEGSDNNTGGDNIFANGTGGNLFRGNNSQSVDVFVVDDAGNTTIGGDTTVGGTVTVTGEIRGNGDIVGIGGAAIPGVEGSAAGNFFPIGVQGDNTSDPQSAAVFALGRGGFLFQGESSTTKNVFFVDDAGNVFAHSFNATLSADQKTSTGLPYPTYASEASTPNIEDFGEATLVAGNAYVRLNPGFASATAAGSSYLVFITPQGPTRESLYVTRKTPYGFQVRENYPGQETVAFDYRIVAKPYSAQIQPKTVPRVLRRRPQRPVISNKIILRRTHDPKPGLLSRS